MRANSVIDLIGNTPHIRINKLFGDNYDVWMKLERQNPGGSLKDRVALGMILDAERKGLLKPGGTIVEPTSGNTGIALAMIAAVKGYKLILVMPESMSAERRAIMLAYGAEIILTPREQGMRGAVEKAYSIVKTQKNHWMPMQFENPANTAMHKITTAQEIVRDFPNGFDYLITGVGTGGHITACAEYLQSKFSGMKVYAVEPESSAVLQGGKPGPHQLQGIGPGFIPKILNQDILDGVISVPTKDAFTYTERAAKEEGLFVGISTGASLAAIAKKLPSIPVGSRILTFCYDSGERYLSVEGLYKS